MIIDFSNGYRAGTSFRERTGNVQGAIYEHSGAEHPEAEVRWLEGTLKDGGTIFGSRLSMRRVTFGIDFQGVTRREIARAFVPGTRLVISRVTPAGGMLPGEVVECYLPCTLDTVSFVSQNLNSAKVLLSFVSAYPYPLSTDEFISGSVEVGVGLEYPHEYPYEYGSYDADDTIEFRSRTEVNAEPTISFTSGVVASSLTLTLNETIVIDTAIAIGDVVVVDSAARTVTINGVNSLEAITEQSEWPVVVPGNNVLVSSELGMLTVSYAPRLVGLL